MKKSNIKKMLTLMLAFAMVFAMTACGGGSSSEDAEASGGAGDGTSITLFNSKNEIQEDFENLAKVYEEQTGVHIEVYYSQDTVSAHLATKYASKAPYTINMVDAKDIYSLGKQYGADMSDCKWVGDTDYAISVDDKVLGFPTCIECRGILYNSAAIKNALGEDFDPATIKTLDDFKAMCDKLVAAGMETPTAILGPDWSLAAHYLQQVYEEREDPEAFIQDLYAGKVDLMKDEKFNALMDTFDTLKQYNMFTAQGSNAEDELVHQAMSEGTDAFQFGGCWEWNDLLTYDYNGPVGIMPVPQNVQDDYTGKLVGGGSKYFYVDGSEYTSEADQAAGKAFLDWLATSDEGKTFVSDTCGMVSPFKSNTVPCTNDIGKVVKEYVDAGLIVPNYDYDPDDHYSKLGIEMKKYLDNACTREELAKAIQDYWASTTPVEH
ncbi:MAG: carbohydrate ABC transporter substrate-binding protein [Clostridiales bacterium]|nr:carbohydrate ABC transporter substrate-binding protein [Clostridiales bacterium]